MKRVVVASSFVALAFVGCASAPPPPPPPPPPPAVTVQPLVIVEQPKPETPDADFRRQPPLIETAPPKARAMAFEEAKTLSGLRVAASPERSLPIVSLQLVIRFSRDTREGVGRALSVELSRRGPGSILTALEALGGTALVEAHADALHVAVNLSSPELPRAIAAYAKFIVNPTFAPAPTEGGLGLIGTGGAGHDAARRVLPADHPYARFEGHAKSKPDELIAALKTLLKSDGVSFVVAGDARASDVAAMVDRELPSHKPSPLLEPRYDRPLPAGAVIVDTESSDTQVSLVALGPARSDADYAVVLVANDLLRTAVAQVSSRAGWSGAHPTLSYDAARGESPWVISMPAMKDKTSEAIDGIMAAIHDLSPTQAQVTQAAKPWTEWTETLLDRQSDHAWSLARIVVQKDGDPSKLHASLVSLTPADIRRVLDKWLLKKQIRLVVRGPAKVVRGAVDKAGFGVARVVK